MMRRVVKVGGSLLLRDDLLTALPRWLASQVDSETLIIVGGGELIDAIRNLDRVHGGDAVETHWLCVDLLDTTFRIVSGWFDWDRITTPQAFQEGITSGFSLPSPTLVSPRAFYTRDQVDGSIITVPLDWRTTTDTIAALLALRTAADELVLLKSCEVDPAASLNQLAAKGIVDEALPTVQFSIGSIRVEQLPHLEDSLDPRGLGNRPTTN
jgi:aspartokinase-like uncharacterized kinase